MRIWNRIGPLVMGHEHGGDTVTFSAEDCDHEEFSESYAFPGPEGVEGGATCAKCGAIGGFETKVYWVDDE